MENLCNTIEEIVGFLSEFGIEATENPNLKDVLEIENISIPLAFALQFGYAHLTDKGEQAIRETYNFLVSVAEERNLEDLIDIFYVEEPVTPRKMIITINPDGTFE